MDSLKDLFDKYCITEKDGKKYLNEFGGVAICYLAISVLNKIFSECLKEEPKND